MNGEQHEAGPGAARIGRMQFQALAGTVVLANSYAGGCVTYELGPFEAALTFAATPIFIFEFLLGGLAFYLVAIGILGLVAVAHRFFSKRWLTGEAFLIWSTAINFTIVALARSGSA